MNYQDKELLTLLGVDTSNAKKNQEWNELHKDDPNWFNKWVASGYDKNMLTEQQINFMKKFLPYVARANKL